MFRGMEFEFTKGIIGICSPEHFEVIKSLRPTLSSRYKYPVIKLDGRIMTLHKFLWVNIMKREIGKGIVIDHVDGNPLNFTAKNLRAVSYSVNNHNRETSGNKHGYRGICINGSRWSAKYGMKHLGNAATPEEAARIWDAYIIKHVDYDSIHLNFKYTKEEKESIPSHSEPQVKRGDDLPPGVYVSQRSGKDYYSINIGRNQVGYTFLREEAIKMAEDYRDAVEREKREKHYNLPVLRNEVGDAIIPLSGKNGNNKFAIVTDSTWHDLILSSWYVGPDGYPASRRDNKLWHMHTYLTRFWVRGENDVIVDHIQPGFENRLDNRLDNLRLVNYSQNASNCIRQKQESELETGIIRGTTDNAFVVRFRRDGVFHKAYFSFGTEAENLAQARHFLNNPRELTDEEKYERQTQIRANQSSRQKGILHESPHTRKNPEHNNLPKYISIHQENGRECVVVSHHPTLAKWKQSKKNVPTETKIQQAIHYIEFGLKT